MHAVFGGTTTFFKTRHYAAAQLLLEALSALFLIRGARVAERATSSLHASFRMIERTRFTPASVVEASANRWNRSRGYAHAMRLHCAFLVLIDIESANWRCFVRGVAFALGIVCSVKWQTIG